MKKVNYSEYKDKYSKDALTKLEQHPESIDVEAMRAILYGYTFTEDYANGEIPDELSMDYWCERHVDAIIGNVEDDENGEDDPLEVIDCADKSIVGAQQEPLLLKAIESTGDGKTKETALCVIDVHQEYEYMERVFPYSYLKIKSQSSLEGGIDRITFEPIEWFPVNPLYFDISRRFEVGYQH